MPNEPVSKAKSKWSVATIAVAGVVTVVAIMYFRKCYVVIGNKKYGFNPDQTRTQQ